MSEQIRQEKVSNQKLMPTFFRFKNFIYPAYKSSRNNVNIVTFAIETFPPSFYIHTISSWWYVSPQKKRVSESTKDYVAMATPLFPTPHSFGWQTDQIESMDVFSSTSSRESPMLLRRNSLCAVYVQRLRWRCKQFDTRRD